MAKNFIQPGDTLTVVAPADVSSGEGVLVGNIFGIAQFDAKSGDEVEIATRGVFEHAKTSAQAWATVGLEIYWDAGGGKFTTTASTNKLVGVNVATAANPSATGIVRLNGVFGSPSIAQMTAGDA
jgi:predicted RecA/RadA family phage recombinase